MPRDVEESTRALPGEGRNDELDEVLTAAADAIWESWLYTEGGYAAEDDRIDSDTDFVKLHTESGEPPPEEAYKDARQIVRAVEKHYGMSVVDLIDELGAKDADELGYYMAMQTLGHGVSFSDDHGEELWTPDDWGAGMWFADEAANDALEEYIEDLDD